ncbi:MAG: hypothetical protein ACTHJM_12660 [Marmoricola sp.]
MTDTPGVDEAGVELAEELVLIEAEVSAMSTTPTTPDDSARLFELAAREYEILAELARLRRRTDDG